MGQLSRDFPGNLDFKNNLAMANGKLGETHIYINDFAKAEPYFRDYLRLSKELMATAPQDLSYQTNYAVALWKLADLNLRINKNAEAKDLLLQGEQHWATLAAAFPDNPWYQQNLVTIRNGIESCGFA